MPKLFPDDYVESIYRVDFRVLYQEGYRALIFDVDNTLVPHNAPADDRAKAFFAYLNGLGYRSMFVSNNKEPRVKKFCEDVGGFGYIFKANKPSPRSYLQAADRLGVPPEACLTKPVLKWHEEIQIILKRLLEALILAAYRVYTAGGRHVKKVPLTKGDCFEDCDRV